jgi:hypothetical protein
VTEAVPPAWSSAANNERRHESPRAEHADTTLAMLETLSPATHAVWRPRAVCRSRGKAGLPITRPNFSMPRIEPGSPRRQPASLTTRSNARSKGPSLTEDCSGVLVVQSCHVPTSNSRDGYPVCRMAKEGCGRQRSTGRL